MVRDKRLIIDLKAFTENSGNDHILSDLAFELCRLTRCRQCQHYDPKIGGSCDNQRESNCRRDINEKPLYIMRCLPGCSVADDCHAILDKTMADAIIECNAGNLCSVLGVKPDQPFKVKRKSDGFTFADQYMISAENGHVMHGGGAANFDFKDASVGLVEEVVNGLYEVVPVEGPPQDVLKALKTAFPWAEYVKVGFGRNSGKKKCWLIKKDGGGRLELTIPWSDWMLSMPLEKEVELPESGDPCTAS